MTKALATMVKAGLPVLDAIGMAREQVNNKKLLPIINQIYNDVESGQPLSEAFSKYERNIMIFDWLHALDDAGNYLYSLH